MQTELVFAITLGTGLALLGATVWALKAKSHQVRSRGKSEPALSNSDQAVDEVSAELFQIPIAITKVELEQVQKNFKLSPIKDQQLVEKLTAVIPGIAELVAKRATKITGEIYRSDIPYKDLVRSKAVKDAVRASAHGSKGITKNANLTKIEPSKVAEFASVTSNVMNVASMVVGQYYMAEITAKLEEVSRGVDRIIDHQEARIKGQLLSSLVAIAEISRFQVDVIENNDLRLRKLEVLEAQKQSISSLLFQVNALMERRILATNPKQSTDGFKEYEGMVHELNSLQSQQKALLAVLGEAAQLEFVLDGIAGSYERSAVTLEACVSNSQVINEKIHSWHERQFEALGIDLEKHRAGKSWKWNLPGALREEWKYLPIEDATQNEIVEQSSSRTIVQSPKSIAQPDNVTVVVQDGLLFYAIPEQGSET